MDGQSIFLRWKTSATITPTTESTDVWALDSFINCPCCTRTHDAISLWGCMSKIKKHWNYPSFAWELVSPRQSLLSHHFEENGFNEMRHIQLGISIPLSCQYLDKDELLHMAGAPKERLKEHLPPNMFMRTPRFECMWQVFNTQGAASQTRALPAVVARCCTDLLAINNVKWLIQAHPLIHIDGWC